MRKVVSRSEVFQFWANQTQSEATEKNGGRTFFEGKTCYSYGRHFPIARILSDGNNCLFTLQGYSNTTSKHIAEARWAANRAGINLIYCYDLTSNEKSLNYWRANIEELFEQLRNKRNRNVDGRLKSLRHNVAQLEKYCSYFGITLDLQFAVMVAMAKGENLVSQLREAA